jgi:hypothetical protein
MPTLFVTYDARNTAELDTTDYVELYVSPNHRLLSLFIYDAETSKMRGYNLRLKHSDKLDAFKSLLAQKVEASTGNIIDTVAEIMDNDDIKQYVDCINCIDE